MLSNVSGSSSKSQELQPELAQNGDGRAKIIAGFPGVGKSYLTKKLAHQAKVLDSDSTQFSKLADMKSPNPAWPGNYIAHIKDEMVRADVIFVSTHKDVRSLLSANKAGANATSALKFVRVMGL